MVKKEEAEKYLNRFSEKSGIEKKYIQKWIPIVAAAHLSKASEEEKNIFNELDRCCRLYLGKETYYI